MRHNVAGKRLGRNTNQRKALMKNLATSLIQNERIETTLVKAKELRRYVEPFITLAKNDSVANRRLAMARLGSKTIVQKLFSAEFRARFTERPGGYTQILKGMVGGPGRKPGVASSQFRLGDGAEMAIIQLVGYVLPEPKAVEEIAE